MAHLDHWSLLPSHMFDPQHTKTNVSFWSYVNTAKATIGNMKSQYFIVPCMKIYVDGLIYSRSIAPGHSAFHQSQCRKVAAQMRNLLNWLRDEAQRGAMDKPSQNSWRIMKDPPIRLQAHGWSTSSNYSYLLVLSSLNSCHYVEFISFLGPYRVRMMYHIRSFMRNASGSDPNINHLQGFYNSNKLARHWY